jgi:hypothetical protein
MHSFDVLHANHQFARVGDKLDRAQVTIQFRALAQDLLDQFGIANSDN